MSAAVDRVVEALKWPVALAALAFLPGTAWAFASRLGEVIVEPDPLLPFLGGFVAYFALWLMLFRRAAFGSLISTFEHELTHAIFAWATFHRVIGLRATWRDGGEIRFRGRGNWLITVAPYFFPTASIAAMAVIALVPRSALMWAAAALGLTVSYHLTSTWLETHRRQPDLVRVGFPFAFAFLPTANLWFFGAIVAFAYAGLPLLGEHLAEVGERTVAAWTWVGERIGELAG